MYVIPSFLRKYYFFCTLVKSQIINCQPIKAEPLGKIIIKSFNCPGIPHRKFYILLHPRQLKTLRNCGSSLVKADFDFFLLKRFILFHAYGNFACMYISTPCVCQVPMGVRRRHQVPWNWSWRQM